MKVAIITDTHFGVRNDNSSIMKHQKKFYDDVFFPEIDARDIKTVLHLGDMTDRRKYINFNTANFMEETFIQPMKDRGIDFHMILGNHDVYHKNTNSVNSMNILYGTSNHGLHVYQDTPEMIELDGTKILMVPWITKDNRDESLEIIQNSRCGILMGHLDIKGFEMYRGAFSDHGFEEKFFEKFNMVFSGHFHQPSSHNGVHYLGAPYEMNWSDYDCRRGFHIFDTSTLELEFINNPNTVHELINYSDTELSIDDVASTDFSKFEDKFVKVVVKTKTKPDVYDLFIDALGDANCAEIRVVEEIEIGDLESVDEAKDTQSIIKDSVKNIETSVDKDRLTQFLMDLYQDSNV